MRRAARGCWASPGVGEHAGTMGDGRDGEVNLERFANHWRPKMSKAFCCSSQEPCRANMLAANCQVRQGPSRWRCNPADGTSRELSPRKAVYGQCRKSTRPRRSVHAARPGVLNPGRQLYHRRQPAQVDCFRIADTPELDCRFVSAHIAPLQERSKHFRRHRHARPITSGRALLPNDAGILCSASTRCRRTGAPGIRHVSQA